MKKNIAFYTILCIFTIILLLSFSFLFCGLQNIRIQMFKEIPTEEKVRDMIIKELKKIKDSNNNLLSNHLKRKKNKMNSINSFSTSKNIRLKKKFKSNIIRKNTINLNKDKKIEKNRIITENKNKSQDELNNLPFTLAIRIDKRNIFQIFISILFQKLELINIFFGSTRIKILCICEYILSLLFDFFFNALLYSDEVVSHKYHNNGELDFIVSLMISLISNIISSIVSNIIEYSNGIEERFDYIFEIRREYKYLYAFKKFIKYLKIKMLLFLIMEIILVGVCFYYIVIFCIIYNKSQMSLLTNYFYSLIEGLITSIIIAVVIVIIRKLGILCINSYLYNASKYLNDKF